MHQLHAQTQRELHFEGGSACRAALLKLEEDWIERQCVEIAKHKPDLVITEKGLSDLAMHFLTKAGISAIRRLRKTDNNRIARATGATIVHRCLCCTSLALLSVDLWQQICSLQCSGQLDVDVQPHGLCLRV